MLCILCDNKVLISESRYCGVHWLMFYQAEVFPFLEKDSLVNALHSVSIYIKNACPVLLDIVAPESNRHLLSSIAVKTFIHGITYYYYNLKRISQGVGQPRLDETLSQSPTCYHLN